MASQDLSQDLFFVAFADSAISLITSSMKLTFRHFATDLPSSFWLSSISVLGFIYLAKNHCKEVQRIADETQNIQRITTNLQDRMLQQEVSSQDQFLQLNTALNESQELSTPYKEVVKTNWEKGRVARVEKTTSTRKSHESMKINQKSVVINSIGLLDSTII